VVYFKTLNYSNCQSGGLGIARIASSNFAGGICVCLLWVLCVAK